MPEGRAQRRLVPAYGAVVVTAGLALRYPITSVSATLDAITAHYGLSPAGVAILSSLPVLMFAAGAPLAPALERRFGSEWSALVMALVLVAALALRPVDRSVLFVGTAVAGLAISGFSVLVPHLVRERLAGHAGLWSGIFTSSFGVSAAAGAALTLPLVQLTGSLPAGLAAWAVPALPVVVSAGVLLRRRSRPTATGSSPTTREGRWLTLMLCQLAVFFGCQAFVFFALTAWLPTILVDRGLDEAHAARLLAWLSIASLPASLGAPVIAARLRRQHALVLGVGAMSVVGLAGTAWAPTSLAPLFVAVLGLAQGAAFGLAVALIVLKAPTDRPVASSSAIIQGFGYAIAALGPFTLGLLRSAHASWTEASVLLIGVNVIQAITGWGASRQVQPPSTQDTGHPRHEID